MFKLLRGTAVRVQNKIIMLLVYCMTISSFSNADVEVKRGWIRAVPQMMTSSSAYFEVINYSGETIYLVGAKSGISQMTEIHQSRFENGLMNMGKSDLPIAIEPGQILKFEPKSMHLMLMHLNMAIKLGELHQLELRFKNIEPIVFSAEVKMESDF